MSWPQRHFSQQHQPSLDDRQSPHSPAGEGLATSHESSGEPSQQQRQRQMGPPSQTLPSLNFRHLAPLRSPNLPSYTHSSSYFSQKRNRSTSESIANDALRTLQYTPLSPPVLPEPPSGIKSSAYKGEVLPPLAAFGHPAASASSSSSSAAFPPSRGMRPSSSTSALHYPQHHPYQSQPQHPSSLHSPTSSHSHHSSHYRSPSTSPQVAFYPGILSRSQPSGVSMQDSRYFSPSDSAPQSYEMSKESSDTLMEAGDNSPRKLAKSHVPSACLNCKRAHLACDVSRPCRRCINLGKTDTCIDVQHKKRGRPRLRDQEEAAAAAATNVKGDRQYSREMTEAAAPPPHYQVQQGSSYSSAKRSPRAETRSYFPPPGKGDVVGMPYSASPSHHHGAYSGERARSISNTASLRTQGLPAMVNPARSREFSMKEEPATTVSLILSTGLQCARCSVESYALLGYSPSELVESSLLDLVHPTEVSRLEHLWLNLIEPVGVKPHGVPASAETVMSLSPAILMSPAPGTVYMQETMRLRQSAGLYEYFSVRLHLGGGLGADLFQPSTLDRAYLVASILKLGNDATHPDPYILREAKWHLHADPRKFTTPHLRPSMGSSIGVSSSSGSTVSRSLGGLSTTLPPPPAPPSYKNASMEMDSQTSAKRLRYSPTESVSRIDWQRWEGHGRVREEKEESSGLSNLPAPPAYRRTSESIAREQPRSAQAVQPVVQSRAGDHVPTMLTTSTSPARAHQSSSNGSSSSNIIINSAQNSHNSGSAKNSSPAPRISSIPFSYSSRSESGGITC